MRYRCALLVVTVSVLPYERFSWGSYTELNACYHHELFVTVDFDAAGPYALYMKGCWALGVGSTFLMRQYAGLIILNSLCARNAESHNDCLDG